MRCEIFVGQEARAVQKEIDIWLKNNHSAKIQFVTQSESAESEEYAWTLTITIFYEEK